MTVARTSPLVLIVDDNEKNLKLARDVLRAAGLPDARGGERRRGDRGSRPSTPRT